KTAENAPVHPVSGVPANVDVIPSRAAVDVPSVISTNSSVHPVVAEPQSKLHAASGDAVPEDWGEMYSITKRAALAPPGSFFWGIVHRAKLLELKAKVTCLKCSGIFQRGRCLDCKGFPPYPKLSIQATFVINEVD
ncbi:hypothetical protein L9F63_024833, partial [Diploptera punctata]